jgi:hypothetical protein
MQAMPVSPLVVVAILVSLIGLLMLAALAIIVYRTLSSAPRTPPASADLIADARLDPGEQPASLVAEQIEEMVKKRLAAHSGLAGREIDFGTMPDGSFDIWVDGVQYNDISDIADQTVRQVIAEAVEEWNRREG